MLKCRRILILFFVRWWIAKECLTQDKGLSCSVINVKNICAQNAKKNFMGNLNVWLNTNTTIILVQLMFINAPSAVVKWRKMVGAHTWYVKYVNIPGAGFVDLKKIHYFIKSNTTNYFVIWWTLQLKQLKTKEKNGNSGFRFPYVLELPW
jgi:hypothetical protein